MLEDFALLPHSFWIVVIFVFGSLVGSFINCFHYRWPRRISVWKKSRSFCPKCKAQIAWYDNVPILSWVLLLGRCRRCQKPIHWFYPAVELMTAVLFVMTYLTFRVLNHKSLAVLGVHLALIAALIAIAFVDCQVRRIPNEITYPGIPLAIVLSVIFPELHEYQPVAFRIFSQHPGVPHRVDSLLAALHWAILSGGVLFTLGVLWRLMFRKEAMGFGDVKMMAMVGGVLGHYAFLAILVASSLGAVVYAGIGYLFLYLKRRFGDEEAKKQKLRLEIPFGPLLAIGTGIMIFWGPALIGAYLRMMNMRAVFLDYVCIGIGTPVFP